MTRHIDGSWSLQHVAKSRRQFFFRRIPLLYMYLLHIMRPETSRRNYFVLLSSRSQAPAWERTSGKLCFPLQLDGYSAREVPKPEIGHQMECVPLQLSSRSQAPAWERTSGKLCFPLQLVGTSAREVHKPELGYQMECVPLSTATALGFPAAGSITATGPV